MTKNSFTHCITCPHPWQCGSCELVDDVVGLVGLGLGAGAGVCAGAGGGAGVAAGRYAWNAGAGGGGPGLKGWGLA